MPRSYAVDLDELQDRIDQMSDFETTIETALGDLARTVERLHLTWTGQAAGAHAEAHQKWAEGMTTMRHGLAEIRAASQRAHENYTSAAQTNSSMWAQVR